MNPALARLLVRLGILGPDRLRLLVRGNRLRIESFLLVECAGGRRERVEFLIDSGCSVTTIDLNVARPLGMPFQGPRVPKRRIASTGGRTATVVKGTFRFWLSEDQRASPFVAPIEFEENRAVDVPALFGLKGIIDQLRWTIGPCEPALPDVLGCCVLEDVRSAAERYPS